MVHVRVKQELQVNFAVGGSLNLDNDREERVALKADCFVTASTFGVNYMQVSLKQQAKLLAKHLNSLAK